MNTLYTANQETVRYFDSVMCCRDISDQNFYKIRSHPFDTDIHIYINVSTSLS